MLEEFLHQSRIAYFSMEIALQDDIPASSGGLGVLAGGQRPLIPLDTDEHFSVDGTMICAWASQASFVRKDGSDREAALTMMDEIAAKDQDPASTWRRTLGADKNYDTAEFVAECRARNITPHVAQNTRRPGGSAIDDALLEYEGYAISQTKRQMAERVHAWPKTWSTMRRAMVRGLERMKAQCQMAITGGILLRLVNLTG